MKGFAQYLRIHQTDAERLLWKQLRNRRFESYKFRRLDSLGPYIVDFICFEANLFIEVDGGQHTVQRETDETRSHWLRSRGFTVLRFWNNEVLKQIQSVLETIKLNL
ncbi:MAG: endonuclease domain-containing protein [Gammaproteobacteria bacterium]|nr:endonuclease domain-containing protein [Gammaproteobacteria bacterium]MDE2345484.1 endonuclease domain-containing protein [Gammaproteobacteria bacterium]